MRARKRLGGLFLGIFALILVVILSDVNNSSYAAVFRVKENTVAIDTGKDRISVQICTQGILKVHYLPDGQSTPNTPVVSKVDWEGVQGLKITENTEDVTLETGKMIAKIDKKNLYLSVYDAQKQLLLKEKEMKNAYKSGLLFEHASGDNLYGVSGYDAWESSKAGILRNKGGKVHAGKQGDCGGPLAGLTENLIQKTMPAGFSSVPLRLSLGYMEHVTSSASHGSLVKRRNWRLRTLCSLGIS